MALTFLEWFSIFAVGLAVAHLLLRIIERTIPAKWEAKVQTVVLLVLDVCSLAAFVTLLAFIPEDMQFKLLRSSVVVLVLVCCYGSEETTKIKF